MFWWGERSLLAQELRISIITPVWAVQLTQEIPDMFNSARGQYTPRTGHNRCLADFVRSEEAIIAVSLLFMSKWV